MKNKNMSRINIRQAIEMLAFNWPTFNDYDEEILAGINRKKILENPEALFKIKRAKIRLEKSINDGNVSCYGYEDSYRYIHDPDNPDTSKAYPEYVMLYIDKKVKRHKIYVKKSHILRLHAAEDVEYYADPEHSNKSEYDLFLIDNPKIETRYLDVEIEKEDIEKLLNQPTSETQCLKKEINERAIAMAKKLKQDNPNITNNRAACLIRKELQVKDSQYPSLSTLRTVIGNIVLKEERGQQNK